MFPTLRPVTEIKRHATEIIDQLREDRIPVLITERGREAAVLLDVATYKGMLRRMEVLEAIANGERDFTEGRVISHDRMAAEMKLTWG
jgi:prevent-host-death family protein